jgi:hypothetical protein
MTIELAQIGPSTGQWDETGRPPGLTVRVDQSVSVLIRHHCRDHGYALVLARDGRAAEPGPNVNMDPAET